jgi:hypothetical protein
MRRLWIAAAAMFSMTAVSQDFIIFGTIRNQDNGQIVFTTRKGECKGDDFFVYTKSGSGEVGGVGCYRMVGDQLMVFWNDNSVYSYDWDRFIFSEEALQAMKKR